MGYNSSDVLLNMDKHVFDDEFEDDVEDDDNVNSGTNIGTKRQCLLNLASEGWPEVDSLKVKEVQQHASNRIKWKRDVTKYIMTQVMEMKTNTRTIDI
jgi:hypothetical protein